MTQPNLDDQTMNRLNRERVAFADLLVADHLDRDEEGSSWLVPVGPDLIAALDREQAAALVTQLGSEVALAAVRSGYIHAASAKAAWDALRYLGWAQDPDREAWWPTPFIVATDEGATWLADAHERGDLTAQQVAELVLLSTRTAVTDPHPVLEHLDEVLRPHATAGAFVSVLGEVECLFSGGVLPADLPGDDAREWRPMLDGFAAGLDRALLRHDTSSPIGAWPSSEAVRRAIADLQPALDALPRPFTDTEFPIAELDPEMRWHATVVEVVLAAAGGDWADRSACDLDRLLDWYAAVLAHRCGGPIPDPLPDDLSGPFGLALIADESIVLPAATRIHLEIAAAGGSLPRALRSRTR